MEKRVRVGGRVRCDILAAENIPVKAVGAYVNARVRHNGVPDKSTKLRTRVIKNTSDPVWNEELSFRIRNVLTDSMSFHIYDKGSVQANVLIGACSVNLADEFPPPYDSEMLYKDFVLEFVKGESATGKLHVRISFYPEPPAADDDKRGTMLAEHPTYSNSNIQDSLDPSNDFDSDFEDEIADLDISSPNITSSSSSTLDFKTRKDFGGRTLSNLSSLNAYKEKLRQDDPQKLAVTKKLKNPKELVSLQKKRFQDDRWNLDLAYITDRLIAMGFPSSGMEKYFRNSMEDTQAFLNHYHPDAHKVYNLCSEREYPTERFYRQGVYPFDDHNVPSIEVIAAFCQDLNEWLDENEQNVAAIHCKAGKGRTGLMITAFLPYRYEDKIDVETSLQFYAERRTMNAKGVTIPSQVRFVRYFASIIPQVKAGLFDLDRPRSISKITIEFPPSNFWTNFIITNGSQKYLSKEYYPVVKQRDAVNLSFNISPNFLVNREVKVLFFDEKEKGAAFYFWFHTYWIKGDQFLLRAHEIDKAKPKGGYDAKFNVCVHFIPEEVRQISPKKTTSSSMDDAKLKKSSSDVKKMEISQPSKPEPTSSAGPSNPTKKKPLPLTPAHRSKSNDSELPRDNIISATVPSSSPTPNPADDNRSTIISSRWTGGDPLRRNDSNGSTPTISARKTGGDPLSNTQGSEKKPSMSSSPEKSPRESQQSFQAKILSVTTNF